MNGPKIISELLVLAIVVGCCYGVFTTAVPTEYPPVEIKADESTDNTVTYSGMDVTISTQKFIIDSNMPSDITDVYIEISLSAGGHRYHIGTIDIGTVPAKTVMTTESATLKVPAYMILASLASNSSNEDIKTPILAKLHFSYLKFQNENIIDLGLNLRVDMGFKGKVSVEHEDNSATMKVNVEENSFTQDIVSIAKNVCDSDGKCKIGIDGLNDVGFELHISEDGKTVTFKADGTNGTAYEEMSSFFKKHFENNDDLTIRYSGGTSGTCTVTKEQAESFAKMIEAFYGGSA